MFIFRISILIFSLIFTLDIWAQSKSNLLEEFFNFYNENGMFNGVVLAAEDGEIIFNKVFGFADFENKIPFDSSSVFAIGSITKPYTATAIMMLKEKGLLSYDDKLTKYFPELTADATAITLRNLLTHTSGIPDFRSNKFTVYKLPLITNKIVLDTLENNFNLEFKPGEKYSYSNSNYFLLAMIIEKISGMSYREFIEDRIFKPAGMKSSYVQDEFTDSLPNRVNAYSYYWNKTDYDLQDRAIGHGNIYSTVYDQYLFDQALYTEILVKQETLKEAFDFSLYQENINGYRYGLGWRIMGDKEGRGIVAHRGAIGGFKSLLWRDIKNKNTLVILSNNWWLVEIPEIISGAQNIMENKNYLPAKVSIQALFLDNWYIHGFDAAMNKMRKVITNNPLNYDYSEQLINDLGYFFLYRNECNHAKLIIEFALDQFPQSANLWDSLGEMNSALKNTGEAIKCYAKSLELDPTNKNAKERITKLKME
ncbi:MAG: serine hydrolase domain-containing protein [bacterium]